MTRRFLFSAAAAGALAVVLAGALGLDSRSAELQPREPFAADTEGPSIIEGKSFADSLAFRDSGPTTPTTPAQSAGPDRTSSQPGRESSNEQITRDALLANRDELSATPIGLRGRIAGTSGPVAGAVVQVGTALVTTDDAGLFWFDEVDRQSGLVGIEANGHYARTVAIDLARPFSTELVDVGTISLTERAAGRSMALFGGDVSLAKRYLDPDGGAPSDRIPRNDPTALIQPRRADSDTSRVLSDLAPVFAPYDLVSVSLESVVTDSPDTPRAESGTHAFSLPGSIDALRQAGVDHVALANNRLLDYGPQGIFDTLKNLDDAGITHSGAGATNLEALNPSVLGIADTVIGIGSFGAVEGQRTNNRLAATYQAPGIADLNQDGLVKWALSNPAQAAGATAVVAHAHTGYEYTESAGDGSHATGRLEFLARSGADLVVAHHPHVAQGFSFVDDTLIAESLGNLVFDHRRIDAAIGLALETTWEDGRLETARALPMVLDEFRPSRLTGEPADLTLRRVSYASDSNVVLIPDADGAIITDRGDSQTTERTVTIDVVANAFGEAVVDLRQHRLAHESLATVSAPPSATLRVGRDIMVFGGIEDVDTDDDQFDVPYWALSGNASFACSDQTVRGALALCSVRASTNSSASIIEFDTPIRVLGDRLNEPNKDLSLVAHHAGVNRGDLYIDVGYQASSGTGQFGREQILALPAGNHAYTQSWVDLNMPADDPTILPTAENEFGTKLRRLNARAVDVRIRHLPPANGTGVAMVDDVAVVTWIDPATADPARLRTPNPFDFIRLGSVEVGQTVEVTFVSYLAR